MNTNSVRNMLSDVVMHVAEAAKPLDEETRLIGGIVEVVSAMFGEAVTTQLLTALASLPQAGKAEPVAWPGRQFCEIAERNITELSKWLTGSSDKEVAADAGLALRTLLAARPAKPPEGVREALWPLIENYVSARQRGRDGNRATWPELSAVIERAKTAIDAALSHPQGEGRDEVLEEAAFDAVLKNAGPMWGKQVNGDIYGDRKRRFADGTNVTTSTILSIDGDIIKTRNSTYKVEWYYPSARSALVEALKSTPTGSGQSSSPATEGPSNE